MARRFKIFQQLTIHRVARRHAGVEVEVADRTGARHRINFHFRSADAADSHAETMERWRQRATALTYVRGDGDGVLIDDHELFRLAFEGDASSF